MFEIHLVLKVKIDITLQAQESMCVLMGLGEACHLSIRFSMMQGR